MGLNLTTIRWGAGRRADSDFAREQILDAALRCYQEKTAQKTRMEHIAREAKVSRTTIYRYFQNRDEVLTGVVLRGLHALVEEARDRIPEHASFADFLVEALASLAELVPHSPVFKVLLLEASSLMSRVELGSDEIFGISRKVFKPRFDVAKANGELRDGIDFTELVDWVVHVEIAYVLLPPPPSDLTGRRDRLRRFLVPAIVSEQALKPDRR